MTTPNEDKLRSAIRKLAPAKPITPRPDRDSKDWRSCIEGELDQVNRRLTQIESRLTMIYYLVVIVTVVTVVTNANAAETLIKAVLHIP